MTLDNQYQYWDKVAAQKIFTHPIDIDMLLRYAGKDATILDYGCGYGRVVQLLLDEGFGNVGGCDTSAELINRGLQNGVAGLFHIDTPASLSVADGSVDCILLFAVLTCIPPNDAQRKLIQQLHSKLKPGGILYISDYYLQHDTTEVSRYEYLNNDPANYGVFTLPEGVTFRHHTREWVASLLSAFSIEEGHMVEVRTMNGHVAEAFQVIGRKVAM